MNFANVTQERSIGTTFVLPPIDALPIGQIDPATVRRYKIVGFETRKIAERPFSLLRTRVAKQCTEKGWSVIGVTSAEPAAGKSFVALNLAAALARVGSVPVYLLDLDLTRATIARAFGVNQEFGISDYLAGRQDDFAALGWRVDGLNLGVFPTRPTNANTAELLAGPRFAQLMGAIRARSEPAIVICDLPPAFANDDVMIATQQLDAYLMVVECGKTTKRQLAETCSMLEPTPRLGMVLNRYEGGFSDPYGYNNYSKAYAKYY